MQNVLAFDSIWQLSGGIHRTLGMRYRAYKPRTRSTSLITRCIMAKFRYFKQFFGILSGRAGSSATAELSYYTRRDRVLGKALGLHHQRLIPSLKYTQKQWRPGI